MGFDFLFNGRVDDTEIEKIKEIENIASEQERMKKRSAKKLRELLDSDVWKDVSSIIDDLKKVASNEARAFKSPEFLYGIDFLTKLEKEIVARSNLY